MTAVVPVLLCRVPAATAQQAETAPADSIQKLLARIDSLEKRVAELESERSPRSAAATPLQPAASSAAAAHQHDRRPHRPRRNPPPSPSIPSSNSPDSRTWISPRRICIPLPPSAHRPLLAPHSGPRADDPPYDVRPFAGTDGGISSPAAPGFNAEVERLILRYDANDYFKLSFGRYHTPINYWNTAFHHGQWLQTTISRPEMTQFGGGFIPVHFIGSLVEAPRPPGGLNLNYSFGVGNGRGQVISRGGYAGDINNNRAWLNAFIKPNQFYGLQVGAAV